MLVVRSTGRVEGKVMYGEIELEKGAVITGDLSAIEDYRAAAKPGPAKAVAERAERVERVEAAPALPKPSSSSIERINEAVRSAKTGGARSNLYVAAEGEGKRVATRLLLGRKASA